ncbi:MAG: capsule biosynthesis protein [Hasllibacter sp.]
MTDATTAPGARAPIPTAPPATARPRHWATLASFVVMVVAPTVLAGWYMATRAGDRYVSTMAFSVRTEEVASAVGVLAGLGGGVSASSSSDPAILYDFIQSQELVRQVERDLDLRAIWSRVPYAVDPVYSYDPPGTIEDLTAHWRRMVQVYTDNANSLLELRVQAYDPADAQAIARAVYDRSSEMINELSAIAREDATRYAREDLDQTVERLKEAREAVTRFRNETQIVDPQASMQSQMGILTALQSQLAEQLIEIDILRPSASASDPRLVQAEQRRAVIESRIEEELAKFGGGEAPAGQRGERFADLVGEYERLVVDQQFAEQTYTAALASFDEAVAEARRQSRYLAAHVRPTLAEAPAHPRRLQLTLLVALFSFLIWGITVLAAYALRDRR